MKKKIFTFLITFLMSFTLLTFSLKANASTNFKDLTETKLIYEKVGYSQLKINSGVDGNDIALLYDGEKRTFTKGFTAHADAEVVYAIDFPGLLINNFEKFRAYIGNSFYTKNNGDGIKIKILTGTRKTVIPNGPALNYENKDSYNWHQEYYSNKSVKGIDEAKIVEVNIKDKHAIKFVIERVGNISADHGTIADPILCNNDYVETNDNIVDKKSNYVSRVKNFNYNSSDILSIKKDLYHYYLIENIGFYDLNNFAKRSNEHKLFLQYLLNDMEFLSLFVLGGKPQNNNYLKVLDVLKRLYTKHKTDLNDTTIYPETSIKKSTLAKKMMISIALVNENPVQGLFEYREGDSFPKKPETDPVLRYEIYKFLRDNKTPALENSHNYLDVKVFDNLPVEYMRWVFDTEMLEDEIKWLNYQSRKKKGFKENEFSSGGYDFVPYRNPDSHIKFLKEKKLALPGNPEGEANFKIYEKKWELDKFDIKNDKHVRIWVTHESGQVCGGISKHGSAMLASVGRPSNVVGQPGHGAYINYYFDKKINDFKWRIDNDISHIWQSERWQRMPLDIRNNNDSQIQKITYNMPHLYLTQIILNEYDKYEKTFLLDILANINNDNELKQTEIYRKSLEIQPLNFLAAVKLLQILRKTNKLLDFYNTKKLFNKLSETYINYPMAIRDFYFIITNSNLNHSQKFEIESLYKDRLNRIINNNTNQFMYKDQIIGTAKYYLGQTKDFASFSFDGENANAIVLNSDYENSSIKVRYSIDNKKTFKTIDNQIKIILSPDELSKLNPDYGIYVGLIGTDKLYKIEIRKSTITKNDVIINPIKKIIESKKANILEWSLDKINFKPLSNAPDLNKSNKIYFRIKANSNYLSSDLIEINYILDDKLAYLNNNDLEIVEISEGQEGHKKELFYDGLLLTHYHTKNKSNKIKNVIFKFKNNSGKLVNKIIYFPRYDISERYSQFKEFTLFYTTSDNYQDNSKYTKLGEYIINDNQNPFEIIVNLKNITFIKFEVKKSTHMEGANFYIAGSEIAFQKFKDVESDNPKKIITYFDEDGITIIKQIFEGETIPKPKENYSWVLIESKENSYALIKTDLLNNILTFQKNSFQFKKPNDFINLKFGFDYEIKELKTNFFNIEKNKKLTLKNKAIADIVESKIEIILIHHFIKKTFIKTITFIPDNIKKVVEFYDETGNKDKTIKFEENFKKPDLEAGFIWYDLNNNKFQKVKKEKLDSYLNFKNDNSVLTYTINSKINLEELIGLNFTINNDKIKYENGILKSDSLKPNSRISIEFLIDNGLIKETIKKDFLILESVKAEANNSSNKGLIIGLVSAGVILALLSGLSIFIIIKVKKRKNKK